MPRMGKSFTDEDVDRLHTAFYTALADLFERHKAAAGWPDARLVITMHHAHTSTLEPQQIAAVTSVPSSAHPAFDATNTEVNASMPSKRSKKPASMSPGKPPASARDRARSARRSS